MFDSSKYSIENYIEPGGIIRGEVMFCLNENTMPNKIKVKLNDNSDALFYSIESELNDNYKKFFSNIKDVVYYNVGDLIKSDNFDVKVINVDMNSENERKIVTIDCEVINNTKKVQTFETFWVLHLRDNTGRLHNIKTDSALKENLVLKPGEKKKVNVKYLVEEETLSYKLHYVPVEYKNELYLIELTLN